MKTQHQIIDWETELPLHREWMVRIALFRLRDSHGSEEAAVLCLMLGAAVWVGRTSVDQQDKQILGDEAAGGYTILLTPESPPSSVGFDQLANSGLQNNQDAVKRMFTPLFDQQSQVIFRDHGYTVNEEPVIYVVHGHQGEQYVVPRRNVSFVAHRE
jgi:hypothetical protein